MRAHVCVCVCVCVRVCVWGGGVRREDEAGAVGEFEASPRGGR